MPRRGKTHFGNKQYARSRILPGHFGHDVLNNYLYMFNTAWEFNLTHWVDWGKLRHWVDDAVVSKVGAPLVRTTQCHIGVTSRAPLSLRQVLGQGGARHLQRHPLLRFDVARRRHDPRRGTHI